MLSTGNQSGLIRIVRNGFQVGRQCNCNAVTASRRTDAHPLYLPVAAEFPKYSVGHGCAMVVDHK